MRDDDRRSPEMTLAVWPSRGHPAAVDPIARTLKIA
jgi:hypothetical protein